jgi:dnd system-associated protein 4
MTESATERRVRQPKDKAKLIEQLLDDNDGPFTTRADVMVFAAALGWSQQRRETFKDSLEPIRYQVITRSATVEAFINALSVLENSEDPMILSDDHLEDRVTAFEEYANGGLADIQSELNTSHSTVKEVLSELVRRAGRAKPTTGLPPELEKLLGPADWS